MTTVTLPCQANPKLWDITGGDGGSGTNPADVFQALAAVNVCQACPVFEACQAAALANPPIFRCVQGGLIFEPGRANTTATFTATDWAARFKLPPRSKVTADDPTCAQCGIRFHPHQNGQIFCCRGCNDRARNRRVTAERAAAADQAVQERVAVMVASRRAKTDERTHQAAQLAATGATARQVADQLEVHIRTAKRYLAEARGQVAA